MSVSSAKIRKFKEKAAKLFSKGKYDKALLAYQEVVKADPRDLSSRLRLGDTYRRLQQDHKAIQVYGDVADFYAKDGLLLKAIAACKLILEVDPQHTHTQTLLAGLYSRKYGRPPPGSEVLEPAAPAAAGPAPAPAGAAPVAVGSVPVPAPAAAAPVPAPAAAAPVPVGSPPMPAPADSEPLAVEPPGLAGFGTEPPVDSASGAEVAASIDLDAPADAGLEIEVADDDDDEGDEIVLDLDALGDEPVDISDIEPPPMPPAPEPAELPTIPLFSDLPQDAFIELMTQMSLRRLEPGEAVIRQGEQGDSFFVMASGSLRVHRTIDGQQVELARLGEGHFFGEMALLSDAPRSATVEAVEDSDVFELSRDLLESLTERFPSVGEALQRFYRQRLVSNLMATSPVFRPFEKEQRKELIRRFTALEVPAGEVIVEEGKPSGGLYLIMTGEAAVTRGTGFEEMTLARLSQGDIFGEMSLIKQSPAGATVRAIRNSSVLRLPTQGFTEIMMTHPQILEVVANLSEERERQNEALAAGVAEIDEDGLILV